MRNRYFVAAFSICVITVAGAWLVRPNGTGDVEKGQVMTLLGLSENDYVTTAKKGHFSLRLVRDASYDIPCTKDGGATYRWFNRSQRIDSDLEYWYNPSSGNLKVKSFGTGLVQNNVKCPTPYLRLTNVEGDFIPAIMTSATKNELTVNGHLMLDEMRRP